jgi:hypothetical protein
LVSRRLFLLFISKLLIILDKKANQFRALEEDEIMFLDSVREKQEAEERQRKLVDSEEVRSFKEYDCLIHQTK